VIRGTSATSQKGSTLPTWSPLVKIVGGTKTRQETTELVSIFDTGPRKRTVRLNREVPGHVANCLSLSIHA